MTPRKHSKLITLLILLTVGMFAFGFALIPMYNALCKVWGINGKTNATAITANSAQIDTSREITIEFLATNNGSLTWTFHPTVTKIRLHPGEMKKITYFARNNTNETMTVQAIPSVTPGLAAKYLKKTECFCFNQQTLAAKAEMDMPILFHLDPELPKDIKTITLAYTLFDVTHMKLKATTKGGKIS